MLPASIKRDLGRIARHLGTAPPVHLPDNPVGWIGRAAGLDPDAWQADVLRSEASRLLLLCARQTGKSTAAAWLVSWKAASRPKHRVALIAPTERQAKNLLGKVLETLQAASPVPAIVHRTATTLRLANGSSIVALPGDRPDTVRGLTLDFAVIDEAAYTRPEILRVLMPMLATTDGTLVMLSTPAGPVGPFHEIWSAGGEEWTRIMIRATACPRITQDFLNEAKLRLGPALFDNEFNCEFLLSAGGLFDPTALTEMFGGMPATDWAERLAVPAPEGDDVVTGAEAVLI
jgi:phage terminase large subunit-like protein